MEPSSKNSCQFPNPLTKRACSSKTNNNKGKKNEQWEGSRRTHDCIRQSGSLTNKIMKKLKIVDNTMDLMKRTLKRKWKRNRVQPASLTEPIITGARDERPARPLRLLTMDSNNK